MATRSVLDEVDADFSIHTSYHTDFFLLRTKVLVNGENATIRSIKEGTYEEPVMSFCHGGRTISTKLWSIANTISPILHKCGIYHVDTFYYDKSPLFHVTFSSESCLKSFLLEIGDVIHAIELEIRSVISSCLKSTRSHETKSPQQLAIEIQPDLFLVSPNLQETKGAELHLVTAENYSTCVTRWKDSKLFDFGSLYKTAQYTSEIPDVSEVDSTPLDLSDIFDVTSELSPIAANWKSVGAALQVKFDVLESIDTRCTGNPRACLSGMVKEWLKRNYNVEKYGEPTWQRLVEVVVHPAGGANSALARDISRRHKAGVLTVTQQVSPTPPGDIETQTPLSVTPLVPERGVEPHGRTQQERFGGFECEFVEPPPSAFQTECPICMLVLRDPYQCECCGKSFCHSCSKRIQAEHKPCPTCKEANFKVFQDNGLKHSLNQLQVSCTYTSCKWKGELGELEHHMIEGTHSGVSFPHTVSFPRIDFQPSSQRDILPGMSVTFAIQATGTQPLNYQWQWKRFGKEGEKDGWQDLSRQGSTFQVMGVRASNAGYYRCVVSNSAGSETSQCASLTVVPEVHDLDSELHEVTDWIPLGLYLGITLPELYFIQANYPNDLKRCRIEMYEEWQKKVTPTWSAVVQALDEIGERRLASELAQKHGSSPKLPNTDPSDLLENISEQEEKATGSMLHKELETHSSDLKQGYRKSVDAKERLGQPQESKVKANEKASEAVTTLEEFHENVQKISEEKTLVEIKLKVKERECQLLSTMQEKGEVVNQVLQKKIDMKRKKIQILEKELLRKESELQSTLQEVQTQQKELSEGRKVLKKQHEEVVKLHRERAELVCSYIEKEQVSKILTSDKEEMQQRLSTMKVESELKSRQIEAYNAEIIHLREEVKALSSSLQEKVVTTAQLHNSIRGVEVIGETALTVPNQGAAFEWEGYGLKLYVPDHSLPGGMEEAMINIRASVSGQFQLLENSVLLSPVFWISAPCKSIKPVTLEIQHCALREDETVLSDLSFVSAKDSQEYLPYRFKQLAGGVFTTHSSYGSIQLTHFCGIGITGRKRTPRSYCAHLYHTMKQIYDWRYYLAITQDLEAHITAVENHYNDFAKWDSSTTFEFEGSEITLDIPQDGKPTEEGWSITPNTPTVITKREADKFKKGKLIRDCELMIKWKKDDAPVRLEYKLVLNGASAPKNFLRLVLNPKEAAAQGSTSQSQKHSTIPGVASGSIVHSATPKLKDLLDALQYKVASQWKRLGVFLEIPTGRLANIEAKHHDPQDSLQEMLQVWLNQVHPPPTWASIINALRSLDEQRLAGELTEKYAVKATKT